MTTKETWTFFLRRLFLFARLSYYIIAVLRFTKSSTLLSAPVLASTQQVSLVVIENVTDIFFPKWAILERCEGGRSVLSLNETQIVFDVAFCPSMMLSGNSRL